MMGAWNVTLFLVITACVWRGRFCIILFYSKLMKCIDNKNVMEMKINNCMLVVAHAYLKIWIFVIGSLLL